VVVAAYGQRRFETAPCPTTDNLTRSFIITVSPRFAAECTVSVFSFRADHAASVETRPPGKPRYIEFGDKFRAGRGHLLADVARAVESHGRAPFFVVRLPSSSSSRRIVVIAVAKGAPTAA